MSIKRSPALGDSRRCDAWTFRSGLAVRRGPVHWLAVALVSALTCVSPWSRALAAISGSGDVLPFITIPDPDGAGPLTAQDVPDLPQFGGSLTGNNGVLVVGGTGEGPDDAGIGGTAAGSVTISSPTETDPLVTKRGIIGGNESNTLQFGTDGQGVVSIAGLNSAWRISDSSNNITEGDLVIGRQGQGFLEVFAGARVVPGDVTKEFLGTTNQLSLVVGDLESSQGFITVSGFASLLKSDRLVIGRQGYGSLTILDRARVESRGQGGAVGGTVVVGSASAGSASGNGYVLVDGLGTRWNVGEQGNNLTSADLVLGDAGRATLEVRNQAWVRVTRDVVMGRTLGGIGEATVTGQGSKLWAFRNLEIGRLATGILNINNKALVEVGAGAVGTTTVNAQSFLNMGGGTLTTPSLTNVGVIRGDGRIESPVVNNNPGGDIRNAAAIANQRERLVFTGAVNNNDNIESIGGEMEFQGLVTNNDEIYARDAILRFKGGLSTPTSSRITLDNTVVEMSSFAPSTINGAMAIGASDSSAIIGDLTLSGTNFLEMEIGQKSSHLDVTGEANLAGLLSVTAGPTANLKSGDKFELITATGGIIGTPTLATLSVGGLAASLSTTPTSLFLTLGGNTVSVGADVDGFNGVNGSDLQLILNNFGNSPPFVPPGADVNGDGAVDGADIFLWQQQNGGPGVPQTPVSEANVGTVPEPATGVLLSLGLAGLGLKRRKR